MFVCPRSPFQPTEALGEETEAWVEKYDGAGIRLDGDILVGEDGGATVGDGPEAPTRAIAGFDILECDDLDHAVQVVSEHPMSRLGSIVIRPYLG